jgi:hypothetical protein
MKLNNLPLVLLLTFLFAGCALQRQMRVHVNGQNASAFTAKYDFGLDSGTISTTAATNPGAIIEFPARDGSIEVTKDKPDDEVTLEIFEGKERTLRVISKPGEKGVRATRRAGGWTQEKL